MLKRAQSLRRRMTRSEEMLWQVLRNRQVRGVKFRRQQVLGRYIADFFAASCRLVVEVDGSIHLAQRERDAQRDAWMAAQNLRVLRIPASLVEDHPEDALSLIIRHLSPHQPTSDAPAHDPPTDSPSPRAGEGAGGEALPLSACRRGGRGG